MSRDISNREDIMDSRDVEERIVELQDERTALVDALKEAEEARDDAASELRENRDEADEERLREAVDAASEAADDARKDLTDWDASEEADELKHLEAFKADLEDYCEWEDGATLIRESFFVEAMKEMCEELGDLPKNLPSYIVIDWNATADNLQADYTSGEFDGVTYWAR